MDKGLNQFGFFVEPLSGGLRYRVSDIVQHVEDNTGSTVHMREREREREKERERALTWRHQLNINLPNYLHSGLFQRR